MSWLAADPLLASLATVAAAATVLAAACVLLLFALRRRTAAAREAVALAGMLALAGLPAAHAALHASGLLVPLLPAPSVRVANQPAADRPTQAPANPPLAPATSPTRAAPAPSAAPASAFGSPTSGWRPSAGALLLAGWLALALARGVLDLRSVRRLARTTAALPAGEPRLQRLLAAAAADVGLARIPLLHASAAAVCPATVGLRRPRIVVPTTLLRDHGERATAAMLRHECAHVRLGHHRHAALVLLLRALFGWHPLVRSLLAAHAEAQEDAADNGARTFGNGTVGDGTVGDGTVGDGTAGNGTVGGDTAYVRALVALAERAAAVRATPPWALSALGRSPLRRRIQRLLSTTNEPMTTPSLAQRAPLFLAAGLGATALALVTIAPAQDPPRTAFSTSGDAFLPLQAGTAWTYRIETRGAEGEPRTGEQVVWDWGAVPGLNGACEQWLVTSSNQSTASPEYWSADATGVYEHGRSYLGPIRGAGQGRTRLLPAPVGAETRWTWTEQLAYQTQGHVERDPDEDTVRCTGELVAPDVEVTVPAGTFRAAHVRIRSTCPQWEGEHARELWFARGTGIVKELRTAYGGTMLRELASWQVASAGAVDEETMLRRHLRDDARSTAREPTVRWLERGNEACYLRGRFAVVAFADASRDVVHVEGGTVTIVGADDVPFWQARLQEMNAPPPVHAKPRKRDHDPVVALDDVTSSTESFAMSFLTAAYGRVEGARQGLGTFAPAGSRTESTSGATSSTTCTVQLDCTDARGTLLRLIAVATEADGTLRGLRTEVQPRPEKK